MPNANKPERNLESLGAHLVIASALNDLRQDPEAFARLLVALAQVKQADATEIACLLSGSARGVGNVPVRR